MPSPLPRSPAHLRRLADSHGGYRRLFRWGSLFYGTAPLLALARARVRRLGTRLILVSGTQGKTTTTRALRHVLGLPLDAWSDSNSNVFGEVPWTVLREPRSTSVLPVEVGDGVGRLPQYLRQLQPTISVVLNVGHEHLANLGDLPAAAAELTQLVSALPPWGVAVLNADDPLVRAMADRAPGRVLTFGRHAASDVRIIAAERTADARQRVTLALGQEQIDVHSELVGDHYAAVLAAAMTVVVALNHDPLDAADRLAHLPLTPGRLEPFRSTRGATILSDDYKATPETLVAALRELAARPAAQRWAVLGDLTNLPDSDTASHYRAAASAAARHADRIVTVGPGWDRYRAVWPPEAAVVWVPSLAAAADLVAGGHDRDDVILVKGCEDTRIRRVTLQLSGTAVRCRKVECKRSRLLCEACPDL